MLVSKVQFKEKIEEWQVEEKGLFFEICFPYNIEGMEDLYYIRIKVGIKIKELFQLTNQELIKAMFAFAKYKVNSKLDSLKEYFEFEMEYNDIIQYSKE